VEKYICRFWGVGGRNEKKGGIATPFGLAMTVLLSFLPLLTTCRGKLQQESSGMTRWGITSGMRNR